MSLHKPYNKSKVLVSVTVSWKHFQSLMQKQCIKVTLCLQSLRLYFVSLYVKELVYILYILCVHGVLKVTLQFLIKMKLYLQCILYLLLFTVSTNRVASSNFGNSLVTQFGSSVVCDVHIILLLTSTATLWQLPDPTMRIISICFYFKAF